MDYKAIIQSGMDYIEDNLKTDVCARELAERAGFSLFHYYRLFQSATGMPVMQYILRRRLLHAIYEIHCGSTGIDAALAYGFDTYAGFYKAFQREFGCAPSHFLKSRGAKRPYKLDLDKEEHMIVTHKKAAEILKYWDLENAAVSEIYYEGTGEKNDNAYYVGDAHVLKFTADLGRLEHHIALSRAIEGAGLCAAVPVPTVDGRPYVRDGETYFHLTRRLPGRQMAADDLYEEGRAAQARSIGEVVGRLHLALAQVDQCVDDVDTYASVRDWALPKAKAILGLTDDFCREYLDAFGKVYGGLPRQIVHRDPNPGNIIRWEDRWGFLDFELAERNARIWDPCYAATAVLSESFGRDNGKWLEICREIVSGYDSVVGLTPQERGAVPYVILANQLICVAWFADQQKYEGAFETNKKMTLWLIGVLQELHI